MTHPPETPAERSARQRRNDHARRADRVADLHQSLARIVATGGYPKENPCPNPDSIET